MKRSHWKICLGLLLVTGRVCAAQEQGAGTNDIPSQAEIAAFVTHYTEPAARAASGDYMFSATFRLPAFPAAAWRLYQKGNTIPYHLTAVLTRTATGEIVQDKDVEVFIVDAEGKLVNRVKEPVLSLCPS